MRVRGPLHPSAPFPSIAIIAAARSIRAFASHQFSSRSLNQTRTASIDRSHNSANKAPAPTLKHFLLHQQALSLYRSIIRSAHRLPSPPARDEMRAYAREEFERSREITDLTRIRYLLSTGRAEWVRLRGMFGGVLPS